MYKYYVNARYIRWCNALFVQAVADCQNAAIHITESHENLAGETLIEPHYLAQHPSTTMY